MWVAHAAMLVQQLNVLIDAFDPQMTLVVQDSLQAPFISHSDPNAAELKELFNSFGSDKAVKHSYEPMYAHILDKLGRQNRLRLLEIGLGTNSAAFVSSMGTNGRPGASLRAWAEYLPHSVVFGGEVDHSVLFNEGRIRTAHVDQLNATSFDNLFFEFGSQPFDILIDDAIHSVGGCLNTLMFGLKYVRRPGFIVLEDIVDRFFPSYRVIEYFFKANDYSFMHQSFSEDSSSSASGTGTASSSPPSVEKWSVQTSMFRFPSGSSAYVIYLPPATPSAF